jgi:protein-L-isoaspartate(D-aspartate) O-methyltransferase
VDRLQTYRNFFAKLITASAGVSEGPLRDAFACTAREDFVGEGPWKILTTSGYIETPSDDPVFLYQDVLIALQPDSPINNGQPSLHALCMAALHVKEGETIVHVGAGTGYYTAILSKLIGPAGAVFAYELEPELAKRAAENLEGYPNIRVCPQSGSVALLPVCDVVYVSAGATSPLDVWLDALRPKGRLLFPLTPAEGFGGMLLVTRTQKRWKARFLTRALFIPCIGGRDDDTARRLGEAFKQPGFTSVRSLHRDSHPDESCWFAGEGWWLSTRD